MAPRGDALEELTIAEGMLDGIRKALQPFQDVERVLTKLITITPKSTILHAEEQINQILIIKTFLEAVSDLHHALQEAKSTLLIKVRETCRPDVTIPILMRIRDVIEADATFIKSPLDLRNQRTYAVKSGINSMLDVARQTYKELTEEIHCHIDNLEEKCKVRPALKFDNGRKYWLRVKVVELGEATLPSVFINVIKKKDHFECQTLALVKLNVRLSNTSNEIVMRSDAVIQELILSIRKSAPQLFRVCESVALVDMISSFAHIATMRDYVRPEFTDTLALRAARHPILDRVMFEDYVPNEYFASNERRFHIVTGCNMAGKSTYIRAVALLQIMAQIGCFVPAEYASFSIIHNIFARVSLSDNLEANLSTFSVEMREMAFILRNVDERSLVIIDELGRGTSSRDGLAIAIAMAEALIQSQAFVWFATHFIDLFHVLKDRPGVLSLQLASMRSISDDGTPKLAMLYKATKGTVDASQHYGIDLARALGFPEEFTNRAEEISRDIKRRREEKWQNSESQALMARRKLVLNLYETLQQARDLGKEEALPGYLSRLQEDFIVRMNELTL